MKKFFVYIFIASLLAAAFACNRKKDNTLRNEARSLYENSLVIVNKYTDSIAAANDSSTLLALFHRYDDAISKLNYSYIAGAAYEMSEGENDTLTNKSMKLIALKDSLLNSYAQRFEEAADSTITSISQEEQLK